MAKSIRGKGLNQGSSKLLKLYVFALLISIIALAGLYGYVAVKSLHGKQYTDLLGKSRINSLHIAKYAYQASLGDPQ
ncbi:MAG: DUF1616 domain-containing protein, partial [Gammaproteobacteria bacterium]|nr:DUF1616 domain-containing protein [Gammaproteobacteria bacterium]